MPVRPSFLLPVRALLPLCALLIVAAAPPGANEDAIKRGVDLWHAGDYSGAVAVWRGPAIAGDADAEYNLGQAYKLGNGVPADLRQAEIWYRKAAEQGHPQAQGVLGFVIYQNGDHAGAVPWLKQAAERGDPRASYIYAKMLFNADAVAKDWPLAYAYTTRAAAAGLPQARASLAQFDQFIGASDRKKGLAMARDMARAAPPEKEVSAAATVPPSEPVRTVALASETRPAPAAPPRPAPRQEPVKPPKPASRPAPAPRPAAPVAVAAPVRGGGWRAQLGAFSSEAKAREVWAGFAAKPGLHGLSPSFVRAGAVIRLQAGPLASRAEAERVCRAAGGGCFPVAP